MSEKQIPSIEKTDIIAPEIGAGSSILVLQRHERYQRDRGADNAGSLFQEASDTALGRDREFFDEIIGQENGEGDEVMFLFVSSDTQYANKGFRSMETAQIAQDAAVEALQSRGIDPKARIINISAEFTTHGFDKTGQKIRPMNKIAEPQIFDVPEYVDFLRDKYGKEDGPGTGISQAAWAAHEEDAEREVREELGAEGVHDILDRTKRSIEVLSRYSRAFHNKYPDKRLVIWAASHYDTISPLVKEATDVPFSEYVPVDYGAGVVIDLNSPSGPEMMANDQKVHLEIGKTALKG